MKISVIVVLSIFLGLRVTAQSFSESTLPIVIINTDGNNEIYDDPRVPGEMKIIYRGEGQVNRLSDQYDTACLNYHGRIEIEVRGSSSQSSEKKQYGFSTLMPDNVTKNNVKLLRMPRENDWILNGMVYDPLMMRDYLSYNLSRKTGEYASRTAYCEIIINGDYKGLYLLQEKVKIDDDRVDVVDMSINDNVYPLITGGYITKADKTTGNDPVAWTMQSWFDQPVSYIHHKPEPDQVTRDQNSYILTCFNLLQLLANNNNMSFSNGVPSVIDIPSFIHYMIIAELGSNADAYMYSTFFHKDRNGKLRAGPIWDNDLTYGNDLFFWGFDRSKTDVWQFSNGDNDGSRFWLDLYSNSTFRCHMANRWYSLTAPGNSLHKDSIYNLIDQAAIQISDALSRNNARWGNSVDLDIEVSKLKSFINDRMLWMNSHLSVNGGCNIDLPGLVISKIMYHPPVSLEYPEGGALEFLEIYNDEDVEINLSGVYFAGTGLVYQFPYNSVIPPKTPIVLASNASVFASKYGSAPFGEFSRHLSNDHHDLILADAFGNVIDRVEYYDTIPWPEADGNGKYLKLPDMSLDNALAENWVATDDVFVVSNDHVLSSVMRIYPNPAIDKITIEGEQPLGVIELTDLQGRLVYQEFAHENKYELELRNLSSGTYLIRVTGARSTYTQKILKQSY